MKFMKVIITFIIICLLTELMLRILVIAPAATVSDEELGWMYKPNAKIIHSSEGYAHLTFDAYGFNNKSIINMFSERTLLVFGDSYTEALQVDRANNFVSLASNKLKCMHIYNSGRSGLSLIDYPVVYKKFRRYGLIESAIIIVTPGDINDINSGNYTIKYSDDSNEIISIQLQQQKLSKFRESLDIILSSSSLLTILKNKFKAFLLTKNSDNISSGKYSQSVIEIEKTKKIIQFLLKDLSAKLELKLLYIPAYNYQANLKNSEKKISVETKKLFQTIASEIDLPFFVVNDLVGV